MLWEYFSVNVSVCYLTDLYIDSKCILPLLLKSLNDSLAWVSICCNYLNCNVRSVRNTKFLHSSIQVFCSFVLISIQWIWVRVKVICFTVCSSLSLQSWEYQSIECCVCISISKLVVIVTIQCIVQSQTEVLIAKSRIVALLVDITEVNVTICKYFSFVLVIRNICCRNLYIIQISCFIHRKLCICVLYVVQLTFVKLNRIFIPVVVVLLECPYVILWACHYKRTRVYVLLWSCSKVCAVFFNNILTKWCKLTWWSNQTQEVWCRVLKCYLKCSVINSLNSQFINIHVTLLNGLTIL